MDGESILAVFGLRLPPKQVIGAAFRVAAQTPSAWIAYSVLALCWIVLFARAQRLAGFAAAIEPLPELQRAQLLKQAYPSFAAKERPSHAFIQRRQRWAWLFGLLALVVAASVLAIATMRALP
jgi:hypothetical protein